MGPEPDAEAGANSRPVDATTPPSVDSSMTANPCDGDVIVLLSPRGIVLLVDLVNSGGDSYIEINYAKITGSRRNERKCSRSGEENKTQQPDLTRVNDEAIKKESRTARDAEVGGTSVDAAQVGGKSSQAAFGRPGPPQVSGPRGQRLAEVPHATGKQQPSSSSNGTSTPKSSGGSSASGSLPTSRNLGQSGKHGRRGGAQRGDTPTWRKRWTSTGPVSTKNQPDQPRTLNGTTRNTICDPCHVEHAGMCRLAFSQGGSYGCPWKKSHKRQRQSDKKSHYCQSRRDCDGAQAAKEALRQDNVGEAPGGEHLPAPSKPKKRPVGKGAAEGAHRPKKLKQCQRTTGAEAGSALASSPARPEGLSPSLGAPVPLGQPPECAGPSPKAPRLDPIFPGRRDGAGWGARKGGFMLRETGRGVLASRERPGDGMHMSDPSEKRCAATGEAAMGPRTVAAGRKGDCAQPTACSSGICAAGAAPSAAENAGARAARAEAAPLGSERNTCSRAAECQTRSFAAATAVRETSSPHTKVDEPKQKSMVEELILMDVSEEHHDLRKGVGRRPVGAAALASSAVQCAGPSQGARRVDPTFPGQRNGAVGGALKGGFPHRETGRGGFATGERPTDGMHVSDPGGQCRATIGGTATGPTTLAAGGKGGSAPPTACSGGSGAAGAAPSATENAGSRSSTEEAASLGSGENTCLGAAECQARSFASATAVTETSSRHTKVDGPMQERVVEEIINVHVSEGQHDRSKGVGSRPVSAAPLAPSAVEASRQDSLGQGAGGEHLPAPSKPKERPLGEGAAETTHRPKKLKQCQRHTGAEAGGVAASSPAPLEGPSPSFGAPVPLGRPPEVDVPWQEKVVVCISEEQHDLSKGVGSRPVSTPPLEPSAVQGFQTPHNIAAVRKLIKQIVGSQFIQCGIPDPLAGQESLPAPASSENASGTFCLESASTGESNRGSSNIDNSSIVSDTLQLQSPAPSWEMSDNKEAVVAIRVFSEFIYCCFHSKASRHNHTDPSEPILEYKGLTKKTLTSLEVCTIKEDTDVYIVSRKGKLLRYDDETGNHTASYPIGGVITCSALASERTGCIYLGLECGEVAVFDAKSTKKDQKKSYQSFEKEAVTCIRVPAGQEPSLLYAISDRGNIGIYIESTGTQVWKIQGRNFVPTCIAVSEGCIYVTTPDETMHKLREQSAEQESYACSGTAVGIHFYRNFIIYCSRDSKICAYGIEGRDLECKVISYGAGAKDITCMDVFDNLVATGNAEGKWDVVKLKMSGSLKCLLRSCNLMFAREEDLQRHLRLEHGGLGTRSPSQDCAP